MTSDTRTEWTPIHTCVLENIHEHCGSTSFVMYMSSFAICLLIVEIMCSSCSHHLTRDALNVAVITLLLIPLPRFCHDVAWCTVVLPALTLLALLSLAVSPSSRRLACGLVIFGFVPRSPGTWTRALAKSSLGTSGFVCCCVLVTVVK